MIKKGLLILSILLLAIVIWYRSLIYYGYVQAKGQLQIVWGARPVQEYLDSPNTPDSIRQKLVLVNQIRAYAVEELGISPSNNYTKMYDQKGKPLMWVVTGSEPYALVAHQWDFPVVGGFPYKGFFDPNMAVVERDKLVAQGYDAGIRNAGGWSTLGWLDDPILSDMLRRNEGQLAELIIHELTHFTLFVKDSVEFNENLASFVGKQGAIKFLNDTYGPTSKELINYLNSERDSERFVQHFIQGARSLDSLYHSFTDLTPEDQKLKLKKHTIENIVNAVDTITFSRPERYHQVIKSDEINNTYFLTYLRYHSKQGKFTNDFLDNFDANVKTFIDHYKEKFPVD
jgi:predicted aminopeptidase